MESYGASVTVCVLLCFVPVLSSRKNVLFLMVDDLRPQLGAYEGSDFPSDVYPKMHTPNIDALASRSILFRRAYVQQALCGPSRTSILTGRRPDTTLVHDIVTYFRDVGGNFTTLPQYFKHNDYLTIGMGKIFHGGKDNKISFTSYLKGHKSKTDFRVSWKALDDSELKSKPLKDRVVADNAIKTLRKLANVTKADGRNFFLGVGFYKPHLPFIFPKWVMERYYPKNAIRLPSNGDVSVKMPEVARTDNTLFKYADITALNMTDTSETIPKAKTLELRRAYYSALTWIDSLVGEVIQELNDLGLSESTVISFVSDHGYHLGENGLWGKRTNFELSNRVPMMISIPGLTDKGIKTDELVETVDLFPTLTEAAGLEPLARCPKLSRNIQLCTEGATLMPLIRDPNVTIKSAAFSQNRRRSHVMGYSLRTKQYRYTEWVAISRIPVFQKNWNDVIAVELYDHAIDPYENFNRADDSKYTLIRSELSAMLRSYGRDTSLGEDEYTGDASKTSYIMLLFITFFYIVFV